VTRQPADREPKPLNDYHFLIKAGRLLVRRRPARGRSYNELKTKLVPAFREFIKAGKLMLGICNGSGADQDRAAA
jgi:phosphoribosylformylglycinamidine (FGAM) synthase-like amidotransferase family enzyme